MTTIKLNLTEPAQSFYYCIEYFAELGSTNTYLLNKASHADISGRVCVTDMQTKGRGRRGREWVAQFDDLTFSLAWRFNNIDLSGLSLVVGMAVINVLKKIGVSDCQLKWPNDVYSAQSKLAGILVEFVNSHGYIQAIIGIGLNFYTHDADNKVALEQCLQHLPDKTELLSALLSELHLLLSVFEQQCFSGFYQNWKHYDMLFGHLISVEESGVVIHGAACGVNQFGQLLVNCNGVMQSFASGEVSVRMKL